MLRQSYAIEKMCKYLNVSSSAFYKWCQTYKTRSSVKPEKPRTIQLKKEIEVIFEMSDQTYGSPRITKELCKNGFSVSKPYVARLMKSQHLQAVHKRGWIQTTDSNHSLEVPKNILNREFKAEELGRKWVGDITYVPTGEGWLYLTTVMDLADRAIIGYSTSSDLSAANTTIKAFRAALIKRNPSPNLIFHSDQGIQYACTEFKIILGTFTQSMSRKGNCWDNAAAESFFKTIKTEKLDRMKFKTREEARRAIFEYIHTWYNTRRMHSSLDYKTPAEMAQMLKNKKQNIAA